MKEWVNKHGFCNSIFDGCFPSLSPSLQPTIADPDDKKPEDWDKPEHIPDPDASKPEDWDDEMDGEWEPPMIDNPDYKGEWAPKQVWQTKIWFMLDDEFTNYFFFFNRSTIQNTRAYGNIQKSIIQNIKPIQQYIYVKKFVQLV